MNPTDACAVTVQPGALLATAPATTTVLAFNAALTPYGLGLPLDPLLPDVSLARLVQANAGGRRRLRYGTVARYLRAAVLDGPAGPYTVGGPTIKRATGYGLNRAIVGDALDLGRLHELTFSLRPLPAARGCTLLVLPDLQAACRLATHLLTVGLALSALAFLRLPTDPSQASLLPADFAAQPPGTTVLLAELEEAAPVVARQQAQLLTLAQAAGATLIANHEPWTLWEHQALAHAQASVRLDLTAPRVSVPILIEHATRLVERAGLHLEAWGDVGVGALHLRLTGETAAATPILRQIQALALATGAALSTEFGANKIPAGIPHVAYGSVRNDNHAVSREAFLDAARAIVGPAYVRTDPAEVSVYNLDASIAQPAQPALAVILPANTAEVAALMRLAGQAGVPVVARGAGSGLAGGATPSPGALILALNRLDQLTVDPAQMVAHVGAGTVTAELQRAAEAVGLWYPPDPSSQTASTLGGNLACNAGGPRCVKYGVTADYLLAVTAVRADGSVVRWGDGLAGQAPDNGLAQLLVGSEGTLGLITEATLRLIVQPKARRTTTALFPSLAEACATVEQIMAAGIVPAALELMDDGCLAAVEAYLGLGLPPEAGAMLLMLADGEPEAVEADAEAMAALARAGGATSVEVARSPAAEARLWQARRGVSIALTRIRPSRLGEDIVVPLSQIVACVTQIKQIAAEHQLPIVVFGHAGDGNLHPNILFDPNDPAEVARLWPCAEAIFAAALAVGGTLSGEHGVGTLKRSFMPQAFSPAALAAQYRIKAWLDPAGLLNPGKVLP